MSTDHTMFFDQCPGCHSHNVQPCPAACHLTDRRNDYPYNTWCPECGMVYNGFNLADESLDVLKNSSIRDYVLRWDSADWLTRKRVDEYTPEAVLAEFRTRSPVGRGGVNRFKVRVLLGVAKLTRDLKREEQGGQG